MLISLIILILLTVITCDKKANNTNLVFNKDVAGALKGVAILFVIIGHVIPLYNERIYEDYRILQTLGTVGVTLFLFASGYGLSKSYQKNGLIYFWKKRMMGVYIPYLTITIVWLCMDFLIGREHGIIVNVLAILGIDFTRQVDSTMWYIPYIFFWYLSFYIVFKFVKKDFVKIILLIFISAVAIIIYKVSLLGESSYQWGLHAISFPSGVFYALYFEKVMKKFGNKLIVPLFIVSMLIYLVSVFSLPSSVVSLILSDISALIMLTTFFLFIDQMNYRSLFLLRTGVYSYELYLLEGYLINLMLKETETHLNSMIFIFFVLTFVLAIILNKVTKKINRIIFEKLEW